jgi:hypothetical protein
MKNNKIFNDVLNECIERMLKGVSVEACLKSFPEYAADLKPLLRTVADTHKAADIKPRPEFRQQAGYEFQAAIRDMKPGRSGFLQWHMRWVTVVCVVLVILLGASSTIAASANSLPDGSLYGVKIFTEEVRLVLTPSTVGKAELHTEYADKRVEEIIKMADKGDVEQVVKTTERMNDNLAAVAKLIQPDSNTDVSEKIAPQPSVNTPAANVTASNVTVANVTAEPEQVPDTEPIAPEAAQVPTPTMAPTKKPTVAPNTAVKTTTAVPKTPGNIAIAPSTAVKGPTATQKTPSTAANTTGPFFKAMPAPVMPPAWTVTSNLTKEVTTEKQELKITVFRQAERNDQDLQQALKKAPDSVKPALEKAIKDAQRGYEQALKFRSYQKK